MDKNNKFFLSRTEKLKNEMECLMGSKMRGEIIHNIFKSRYSFSSTKLFQGQSNIGQLIFIIHIVEEYGKLKFISTYFVVFMLVVGNTGFVISGELVTGLSLLPREKSLVMWEAGLESGISHWMRVGGQWVSKITSSGHPE